MKDVKKKSKKFFKKKILQRKKDSEKLEATEIITSKRSPTASVAQSKSLAPLDPALKYMNEIKKYKVLSREEEKEVALLFEETKDPQYAEILVKSNLRFVVKVALEYSKFGAKLIDIIQEGNLGLMHAIKEYNPHKGVRVISYAVWWIRGHIQDYLMKQYSLVKIGTTQNQRKLFYQLQKRRAELEKMGQNEGVALLSSQLGISKKEITDMASRLNNRDLSLDQGFDDEETGTLMDTQTSSSAQRVDNQLVRKQNLSLLQESIKRIKPKLNEKEICVIEKRLMSDSPLTLQQIGDQYKITREAVRQIESRLIEKIKKDMMINN